MASLRFLFGISPFQLEAISKKLKVEVYEGDRDVFTGI